jgi:hypothetical protein
MFAKSLSEVLLAKSEILIPIGVAAGGLMLLGIYLLSRKGWGRRLNLAGAGASTLPATEQAAVNGSPERRQSPRRWGMPIETFVQLPEDVAKPIRGWVVNRSQGGLGLSVPQPISLNTILHVRITHAPESIPWTALEVKSCYFKANRWLLGCQFAEAPEREVFLMFG